jgi:hypothetical protein
MAAAAAPPAMLHAAAAAAAPPVLPPAAAATVATPQIDLSDSDSYISADDDSSGCEIVESVENNGKKTSFVCLSGDVRRVMLDKAKANASKGNPNASSHEVAKTMLQSVVARRTQLVELGGGLDATMEIPNGGEETSIRDLLSRAIPTIIPTKISKISVTVHLVDIWVIMSAVLKTGVLRRTEKHDLQSYLKFMIRIEASSRRELAEADLIDKNAKPYNLPTEEMERLYMSNGGFKPPAQFQTCVKCGHNLVDEPAQNKTAVRDNKRVQLQWEKDSTTATNFLQGKGVSLKDKKGNPTTKVANPKYSEEPLMCHCWQQCMSQIAGGYFCIYGCVDPITGKQYEEGQCPVCLCDCAFVCTKK